MRTGDYIGIYTPAEGLDVSHVGICIRRENRILLRHASSIAQKVIDQDFKPLYRRKAGDSGAQAPGDERVRCICCPAILTISGRRRQTSRSRGAP